MPAVLGKWLTVVVFQIKEPSQITMTATSNCVHTAGPWISRWFGTNGERIFSRYYYRSAVYRAASVAKQRKKEPPGPAVTVQQAESRGTTLAQTSPRLS
jgi:hypothetical protein